MTTLSIDIETYSPVDLSKTGVYPYAAHPEFEVMLFAYSIDEGPVEVIDLTRSPLPDNLITMILDPKITKWAYNASFERVCLSRYLRDIGKVRGMLDPSSWRCSMVASTAIGLPAGLKNVGAALALPQQKLTEGVDLIDYFCTPARPKPANNALFSVEETTRRNTPKGAPEKWERFIAYCKRDVEVELQIRQSIKDWTLPEWLWGQYIDDQLINDHGVGIDTRLAQQAIIIDTTYREACTELAKELTHLENPNSVQQLLGWLEEQGITLESLSKQNVADALKTATGVTRRVLQLRQEMSRSSVKKYQTMLNAATGEPPRAHGLIQFMGAGRTGRWAGRLIQVQNLPRNHMTDLDEARTLVANGNATAIEMLYDSTPDVLSQLIRTALIPTPGNRFIVSDYSAIEARVLAWLAGQTSTLQAFINGEDIYCTTATAMFGVPVEKHGQNAELRQRGKVATLACGYQGGVAAITAMGGARLGMTEKEMQHTVDLWRHANPHIVQYWYDVEAAATHTVKTGEPAHALRITTRLKNGALVITLPSGRDLVYPGVRMGVNRFGRPAIVFSGIGLNKRLRGEETYGGKLVENITQAVARDLLAHAIHTITANGHKAVFHVHDEVVIDAPPSTTVDQINALMCGTPDWAKGLPVEADGYECENYRKD